MIKWFGTKSKSLLEGEPMYFLTIDNEKEIKDYTLNRNDVEGLMDVTKMKSIFDEYRAVDDHWTEEDSEYYGWWTESDYNLEPEIRI